MTTHHMTVPFAVKASRRKARTLTGLASALALDLVGDAIEATAYDAWLADFRAGRLPPITLNDSHRYGSIYDVVGKLVRAERVPQGLLTSFQFIPDDATAKAAWRRADGGYITGLSIGFTTKARQPTADERSQGIKRVLTEVNINEVSLVQYPAQPAARVMRTDETDAAASDDPLVAAATHARLRDNLAKRHAFQREQRLALARRALAPLRPVSDDTRAAIAAKLAALDASTTTRRRAMLARLTSTAA
jgi:HK97 family phage prohead protease